LDVLRLSDWTVLEDSLRAVNSPIQQQQQQHQQRQNQEEFVLHLQRAVGSEKDTKAARREAETAIYEYNHILARVSKCVLIPVMFLGTCRYTNSVKVYRADHGVCFVCFPADSLTTFIESSLPAIFVKN
jgi:hypothetical protein